MAFNPSHEVAVARDAAQKLGDAPMCVIIWVTDGGDKIGMASYGKTEALCNAAAKLGERLWQSANTWGE